MRVERLQDRPVVPLYTLENGQCFTDADGGAFVYMVTEDQKVRRTDDNKRDIKAVDLEDGSTTWMDEDVFVKPLYAKVVVEW